MLSHLLPNKRSSPWLAIAVLMFSLDTSAVGQVLYGSLVGTVTDPSGAVVPNADITVTETATKQVRVDKTDTSGRYNLVNLLPGTYEVKIVAPGFRTVEQSNVIITPNTVNRTDVHLEVGQSSQQVNVSAAAVELQTDKADTHTEIASKVVAELPISSSGYRNYQSLIDLTPGALPSTFYNSQTDVPGIPLNTHINGGNGQTNITTIDGAESINLWLPQYTGYVVPAETVDVVNVTTSAADADQGLAGSSSITVVTKSGTNQIHGSGFEYHNDQHLNARNFFLSPNAAIPVSIYNNYGGTIGGPLVKDKLFYFGSFDGTDEKTSGNGLYTVPTADQRAGNFSAYSTPIYNPFSTTATDGTGRSVFAGNVIPSQYISSQATAIQKYYPAPNLPGVVNNFAATATPFIDRYLTDVKVNWNRTEKHSIFFKYDNMVATSGGAGIFGVAAGPTPAGSPGTGHTTVQVASIGHTYTFSPNLVLDGTVGYERLNQNAKGTDFGTNYGTQLGIPGLNGSDIRDSGFPNINFAHNYAGFGVPNWMPLFRTDETYTTSHKVTWTKGAHEVAFGFNLVRHHLNHWQPELSAGGPRGYFDFNGGITTAVGGPAATQFNEYAQFLMGLSDNTQKGEQYILMTGREWQFAWFVQDRWQVSQKLTVTFGLRYELYPLMTRSNSKGIESYNPSNNDVYMGGRGSVPLDAYVTVSHKLFAPRLGIAYRLNDKTVIRTGYGLNYDPLPYSRPWRGFYPLTINDNYTAPNSYQPAANAGTLSGGIPPIIGPNLSTGIVPLDPNAEERAPLAGELKRGYIQSWNFTVERKLPADIVTSVGYVGQHSTHLLADYDLNAGFPGSGTTLIPLYLAFGDKSNVYNSSGYLSSEYNSLQIAVNRQFSKGLLLKGAYTWSHAIDFTDDDGWAEMSWYGSQFPRNRATAGFDRTQVFQLGWVYDLPVGKGKTYLNSGGLASTILGGWQLSGREECYTGLPFTVTASGSSLNTFDQTQTANQVSNVQFAGGVGPGAVYYNPAAFTPVTTQTFGTSGRNILRAPGVWNTDMDISRNFSIKERLQLQFRTEFYNLPNTSHFNAPDNNVNDANFMRITSSYGERNIRFALHLQF